MFWRLRPEISLQKLNTSLLQVSPSSCSAFLWALAVAWASANSSCTIFLKFSVSLCALLISWPEGKFLLTFLLTCSAALFAFLAARSKLLFGPECPGRSCSPPMAIWASPGPLSSLIRPFFVAWRPDRGPGPLLADGGGSLRARR